MRADDGDGACDTGDLEPQPDRDRDDGLAREYRRSFRVLVHRNRSLLSNRDDSEDAVQDAFLAALESQAQGGDAPSTGWLATVAKRRAIDEIRRRERDQRRFGRLASRVPVDEVEPDVAEAVADTSAARHAVRSLAALPAATRSVVDLVAEGEDTRATAARLGITHRSAESHLQRARKHLRTSLHGLTLPVVLLWHLLRRGRHAVAVAAPAITVAAVVAGVLYLPRPGVAPRVGEQRRSPRQPARRPRRPPGRPPRPKPSRPRRDRHCRQWRRLRPLVRGAPGHRWRPRWRPHPRRAHRWPRSPSRSSSGRWL